MDKPIHDGKRYLNHAINLIDDPHCENFYQAAFNNLVEFFERVPKDEHFDLFLGYFTLAQIYHETNEGLADYHNALALALDHFDQSGRTMESGNYKSIHKELDRLERILSNIN